MTRDVFFVDNVDSFTFNLVDAFERLGCRVRTYRHDVDAARLLDEARATPSPLIVLSPGPGGPTDAGCCLDVVERAIGDVPVFGICLGHQVLLHHAGVPIERCDAVVHGKTSCITHDGTGPFEGLPSPLGVARYHSLCARSAPERFTVHATLDGIVMAVSDPVARQVGVQFHPESILTPRGDALLAGVLRATEVPCTTTS